MIHPEALDRMALEASVAWGAKPWRLLSASDKDRWKAVVRSIVCRPCTLCKAAGQVVARDGPGGPWESVPCPLCGGEGLQEPDPDYDLEKYATWLNETEGAAQT